jgi:hypothetical protein
MSKNLTPAQIDRIRERVLEVTERNLGFGELGGNNLGPFIKALGGRQGAAWCALLAGHFYRRAFELEGFDPAKVAPWLYRVPGVNEPGAARLVLGLARAGRKFTDVEQLRPGDLVLWKRTDGHHVGTFKTFDARQPEIIMTIEGNVGRPPARVRDFPHHTETETHFRCFASLDPRPL